MILQRKGSHAPGDALVIVNVRSGYRPRVGGVETGDVHIAPHAPVPGEIITQFDITAILFKSHIGAMSVRAIVGGSHRAAETSFSDAVGSFGL